VKDVPEHVRNVVPRSRSLWRPLADDQVWIAKGPDIDKLNRPDRRTLAVAIASKDGEFIPMSPTKNQTNVLMRSFGGYSVRILGVFAAYLVAGKIGLSTPFTSNNISPVWPASGVALSAVLLFGYRIWPGIAAAAFLVNWPAIPHVAAVGLACGNTLAALTGAFLLRQVPNFDASLSRLRDVLGLITYAGLVSTMVSASVGVSVLFATRMRPWSGAGSAWLIYWLGDAMGILLVAPLLLTLPKLWKIGRSARIAEFAALLALLSLACFIIFSDQRLLAVKSDVLAFAVFPFVLWAAIRFGVSGCASSTLLIAAIATAETARGFGPFAQDKPLTNAFLLQAFFGVISLSGLTLAAVIAEREDLESEREQLIRDQVFREARLRLAAIVESSADAIISKDMDGSITHWNQAAEQLYGYSSEEVIGKSVVLLMPPERSDDFPEIMGKLTKGERIEHHETVRQRKDGTRINVSLSISPIFNTTGKVVGAAAIARDVSSQKQAEEALRKAEKLSATGRLAAAIAHEINNPLESLTNLVYLLQTNESLDSSARHYVRLAQEELKRTAHLTKQMLAFHRQSSNASAVSLPEVLDNVLDLYAALIRNNGVSIVRRYDADTVIWAFSDEIRQVFANVLRNAIEAVPRGGTITLHVFTSFEWNGARRQGARVVIADTGPGISPENRDRIFEPFFTTKGENGTGLGLWISSGIVLKHGGSIRVRSTTGVGHSGTVFNVFLPYETASHRDQSAVSAGSAA
jgi:PAS domain S-box-containing protein